ncbi:MAG: ATP-binding protein [Lachnospiraceae bacterium]|nr:ATP-binding protein [Lachnospiraceae bacterium]
MKELVLTASDETLYTVMDELKAHLTANACPEEIMTPIVIAAEEVYVNIAHYAYGGKPGMAKVEIDVTPDPKKCRLVFKDQGTPYNPLEKQDPDITLDVDERAIGGLGIYMVKEIMDDVTYEYKDGYNILTIEKRLDEA